MCWVADAILSICEINVKTPSVAIFLRGLYVMDVDADVQDQLLDSVICGVPLIACVEAEGFSELVKKAARSRGLSVIQYTKHANLFIEPKHIH